MIERSFRPHFLAAPGTGYRRERFRVGCIERRAAGWACLYHRRLPSTAIETDCNIQKFQSNERRQLIENTHEKFNKQSVRRAKE
jgi:hypothetical protein